MAWCGTCNIFDYDDDVEICPKCLNHLDYGFPQMVEHLTAEIETRDYALMAMTESACTSASLTHELEEELAGARQEHTRLAEAAEELLEAFGAGPGDMPTLMRELAQQRGAWKCDECGKLTPKTDLKPVPTGGASLANNLCPECRQRYGWTDEKLQRHWDWFRSQVFLGDD